MCIYWVNQYTCGHFADNLKPTLLSHCREYDLVLRHWHDQERYQPLEATNSQMGTIQMPKPCRPIWPIIFPGDRYLPLPNPGSQFPRGLAWPEVDDNGYLEPMGQQEDNFEQRITHENNLMATIGSFQEVASYQDLLYQISIWDETAMYQEVYPGTNVQSSRVSRGSTSRLQKPPYPESYIATILGFTSRRYSPLLPPNVIIRPRPTGCLRTPFPQCNHQPTYRRGLQCPWLLSLRTPWVYPVLDPKAVTGFGIPQPQELANFLADFSIRRAPSKHMGWDARGSRLIRVGLTRDGAVERIHDEVYFPLRRTVPEGPWLHLLPAVFGGDAQPPPAQFAQEQQQPVAGRDRGASVAAVRQMIGARQEREHQQQEQQRTGMDARPGLVVVDIRASTAVANIATAPTPPASESSIHLTTVADLSEEHGTTQQLQRQQQHLVPWSDRRDWFSEGDNDEQVEREDTERDSKSDT